MPSEAPRFPQRNRANLGAWFHDAVYLAMSFVVWNWRKSRYQQSNCTIRCPCQSLSDSGRVGESRCEASYYLKDPRRFAVVCPALKPTPVGLRCHHTLKEVRPYWGRAFIAAFAVLLGCYGVSVSGWFGVLRLRGYSEVQWTDCAWPLNWSAVAIAHSIRFQQQANDALSRGNIPIAIRAFSSAVHADPSNWSNALQLAKLYEQVGQFAASEELFNSLASRYPEHDQTIAMAHHDAMVASQRFESVQDLAWRHLGDPARPSPSWFFVLLSATAEASKPSAIWSTHADRCTALPSPHQALLGLVAPRPGTPTAQATKSALSVDITDPSLAWLRIKCLVAAKQDDEALGVLLRDLDVLDPFDAALARWTILETGPEHSDPRAVAEWQQLVIGAANASQVSRLCAETLISQQTLPLADFRNAILLGDRQGLADLWIVAYLSGDLTLASTLRSDLQIDPLNPIFQFDPVQVRAQLPLITSQLTLSREVQYAIMQISRPVPAGRFAD